MDQADLEWGIVTGSLMKSCKEGGKFLDRLKMSDFQVLKKDSTSWS